MKRTKTNNETPNTKIRWKKMGGGSFRLFSGKIIKPGQVFRANEEEIPVSFRDVVTPLDDLPPEEKAAALEPQVYEILHKGAGRWVVLNPEGKIINDGYLTREEALKLKDELERT